MLFLVHGSSPAPLSSFDFDVPGRGDYLLMDAVARSGLDVWMMDHEGYGPSDRMNENSDIVIEVKDLIAASILSLKFAFVLG